MWIQEIWRYPAKSMAGERLETATLTASGVEGDRILQVRNPAGRVITARTRPLLLGHHAVLDKSGAVLIDGRPWDSESVKHDVELAAGTGFRLVRSDAEDRFDVLPLLVTTDGMLEATGFDRRRFRPNLIIGGVSGLDEQSWEGAALRIGEAVVAMEDLRGRCVMTTFDPDTGEQDLNVLRSVQREFNGRLGLNSFVAVPGPVSVGDAVELVLQESLRVH
jgi:uncharacterized protein YcbX